MYYATTIELGPIGEIDVEMEVTIEGQYEPAILHLAPENCRPDGSDAWPNPYESKIIGGHPLLQKLTEDEAKSLVEFLCDRDYEKIAEKGLDELREFHYQKRKGSRYAMYGDEE